MGAFERLQVAPWEIMHAHYILLTLGLPDVGYRHACRHSRITKGWKCLLGQWISVELDVQLVLTPIDSYRSSQISQEMTGRKWGHERNGLREEENVCRGEGDVSYTAQWYPPFLALFQKTTSSHSPLATHPGDSHLHKRWLYPRNNHIHPLLHHHDVGPSPASGKSTYMFVYKLGCCGNSPTVSLSCRCRTCSKL